jgi:hypothetical protein
MSVHTIVIDTPLPGVTFDQKLAGQNNGRELVLSLSKYLAAVAGGQETAKIRVQTKGTQATGTITLASHVATDTVTVNGVTLTCVASNPTAVQYLAGASDEATANNLRATINAATAAKIRGEVLATRRATVALSAFVANDTVTVNGVVFTGKTTPDAGIREQFAIGATDTATAVNLVAAIQRCIHPNLAALISVSASSGTVTINYDGALTAAASAHATVASAIVVVTCVAGGSFGNLYTLAISAHGSVSGANLASGADGSFYTFTRA